MPRTQRLVETKTYQSWVSMRYRCNNPTCSAYHRYGGRGIKICVEWDCFDEFLKDMGPRPDGMTLDRKDPDGDYTPENCRWATRKQQSNNKSVQKRYTVNGVEGTLTEVCETFGLRANTVVARLRNGCKNRNCFSFR